MTHFIYSMTGFARGQTETADGSLVCELRSINHRYLEMSVHLPEPLRVIESTIRDRIRHHIKRGKVECYIRHQLTDEADFKLAMNKQAADKLCQLNNEIIPLLKTAFVTNTMDILKWPGVLQMKEWDIERLEDDFNQLVEKVLQDLMDARAREGEELRQLFFKRLDDMQIQLDQAKQRLPRVTQVQREKLMTRFMEAKVELDPVRLEQEMVLLAQRIDVLEELDRLSTHLIEVRRILKQGGMVGRRLDFLMQELNREANTLGSKSVDVAMTQVSVELKVLIEQMREQVQNVE